MSQNIQFWFDPTTGTALWFLLATMCMVVIVVSVRILFLRMQKSRKEKAFHDLLVKHDLWGKPEESVVRFLAEKHNIDPPANVLANLHTYDSLAGEEIARAERENVSLANRIDRIEYLYSIRMQAFGHEPSVGGIGALIPDFGSYPPSRVDRALGSMDTLKRVPSDEGESDSQPASEKSTAPLRLEDESDEMAKLLGSPEP